MRFNARAILRRRSSPVRHGIQCLDFDDEDMMIWNGRKKRKKTKRDKQIASCGNTVSIINAFGFIRKGRMQLPLDAQ